MKTKKILSILIVMILLVMSIVGAVTSSPSTANAVANTRIDAVNGANGGTATAPTSGVTPAAGAPSQAANTAGAATGPNFGSFYNLPEFKADPFFALKDNKNEQAYWMKPSVVCEYINNSRVDPNKIDGDTLFFAMMSEYSEGALGSITTAAGGAVSGKELSKGLENGCTPKICPGYDTMAEGANLDGLNSYFGTFDLSHPCVRAFKNHATNESLSLLSDTALAGMLNQNPNSMNYVDTALHSSGRDNLDWILSNTNKPSVPASTPTPPALSSSSTNNDLAGRAMNAITGMAVTEDIANIANDQSAADIYMTQWMGVDTSKASDDWNRDLEIDINTGKFTVQGTTFYPSQLRGASPRLVDAGDGDVLMLYDGVFFKGGTVTHEVRDDVPVIQAVGSEAHVPKGSLNSAKIRLEDSLLHVETEDVETIATNENTVLVADKENNRIRVQTFSSDASIVAQRDEVITYEGTAKIGEKSKNTLTDINFQDARWKWIANGREVSYYAEKETNFRLGKSDEKNPYDSHVSYYNGSILIKSGNDNIIQGKTSTKTLNLVNMLYGKGEQWFELVKDNGEILRYRYKDGRLSSEGNAYEVMADSKTQINSEVKEDIGTRWHSINSVWDTRCQTEFCDYTAFRGTWYSRCLNEDCKCEGENCDNILGAGAFTNYVLPTMVTG